MVRDALAFANDYKVMEVQTMEQLSPKGAGLPVDAVADAFERLRVWRSWAVSYLLAAWEQASEQERREIASALALVNSSERAF